MPKCIYCGKETPVTQFFMIREYRTTYGKYWYFCDALHMLSWCIRHWKIPVSKIKEEGIKHYEGGE